MLRNYKLGWKAFIGFMLIMELLPLFFFDYGYERISSAIFVHLAPIVLILVILKYGKTE